MAEKIKSISFIGAGNVATHLAQAFYNSGFSIRGIFSRTSSSATDLAAKVGAHACSSIAGVIQDSQLVIIAVPDHVLADLMDFHVPDNVILVHASGTLEMNVFKGIASHFGVIYPLQTFSQKVAVDLKNVPFCIEASDLLTLAKLRQVASAVSERVDEIDTGNRKILHLAAVFACNFPNTMYAIADDILKSANLPITLLHPLILETARKATLSQPWNVQTGPARRNDQPTIQAHEAMLQDMESYKEIYTMLSKAIQKHFKAMEEQDSSSKNG